MSRLETAAAPTLIALMDGGRTPESLSPDEAAVVCRWSAKTAYLHTWAGPLGQPVDVAHLRALCGDAGALAAGVGVFAMQSDYSQPTAYIQAAAWPELAEAPREPRDIPADAYKVGLQFRQLYLLVAHWPNPSSRLTRVRGLHIPLTPVDAGGDPEYAIEPRVGDGPIDRLAAFSDSLAVWHRGPAV